MQNAMGDLRTSPSSNPPECISESADIMLIDSIIGKAIQFQPIANTTSSRGSPVIVKASGSRSLQMTVCPLGQVFRDPLKLSLLTIADVALD